MSHPPVPIAQRFWRHVQLGDGCWLWTAYRDKHGYGVTTEPTDGGRREVGAHRVSWQIHFGPIPDGLRVCHHCDNPPCVRPDHLFLGTNGDNLRDAARKGRLDGVTGKFTREQVRAIRESKATQRELGELYGVAEHTIWCIRARRSYRTWV